MTTLESQLAALDVTGLFINLDRSPERRAAVEAQLARFGLAADYARLPGVEGTEFDPGRSPLTRGEVGCFRSHLGALHAFAAGTRHLHVVEDDVVFSSRLVPVINELIRSGTLERYDLVFLDTVVGVGVELVRIYRRLYGRQTRRGTGDVSDGGQPFAVLDFRNHEFAGASSYLVNRASIAKLAALLERELAAGPNTPLDLCYCKLMQSDSLRVACVFPFVTTVRLDSALKTTIGGREGGEPVRFSSDLLRYSFFAEREWATARDAIDAFDPALRVDPHDEIVGMAFAIAANPKYRTG
jgi:GR25 family glycosyltransferase involved in LPS biosynthesis